MLIHHLLVLVGIAGTAAVLESCLPGWVSYGHSCYKLLSINDKLTWIQAFEACQSLDSHLTVPNTLDEKQFIGEMGQAVQCRQSGCQKRLWLGCTKLQEDGELCEGSDIEQHQVLEEGNHVCLRISAFSLELSESSCLEKKWVVCERQRKIHKTVRCLATSDPVDNKALPYCLLDHTYMEIPIRHPMQCCIACYKDPNCLSFNLSGNTCQLNNVTISQVDNHFLIKNQNCASYYLYKE